VWPIWFFAVADMVVADMVCGRYGCTPMTTLVVPTSALYTKVSLGTNFRHLTCSLWSKQDTDFDPAVCPLWYFSFECKCCRSSPKL